MKCPTCGQPLPDAKTVDLRGATVECALCDKKADFIVRGSARCFEHRKVDSGYQKKGRV